MIIGRKEEQKILLSAAQSEYSELIAVYGRRRVGKTYLIRETISLHSSILAWPMPGQKTSCSVLLFHFVMPDTMIAQYHNRGWRHSVCYLIS